MKSKINGSLAPSKASMLFLWLLIFVIPAIIFQWFISYLSAEQFFFSEPEQISEAFNTLDQYKEAMVYENFLLQKTQMWEKVKIDQKKFDITSIKNQIDAFTGVNSVFFLFFDKDLRFFKAKVRQPKDIKQRLILPPSLFKRQIYYLLNSEYLKSGIISETDSAEKLKNSISMQKLFRTIAPVTIQQDRVAKNYSVFMGGELYFVYHEFKGINKNTGCLAVYRGKDISTENVLSDLSKDFPRCRIINFKGNIRKQFQNPEKFNCGIINLENRKVIRQTADQRFVRSFLTDGGLQLKNPAKLVIPHIEIDIEEDRTAQKFRRFLPSMVFISKFFVVISGIFFFYSALFGQIFPESFKKRILLLTGLAAIFPFSLFTTGFYLFSQFNQHLELLNLFQQVRFQMSQTQTEFYRYISQIETTISRFSMQFTEEDISSKPRRNYILDKLGSVVPATHLAIYQSQDVTKKIFPERYSESGVKSGSNAVIEFFPKRALEILQEPQPVKRQQSNKLNFAGHEIKTGSISDSLLSDGAFFMNDQMRFYSWFSATKIFKTYDSDSVYALLVTRFEAGFLLKSYLKKSMIAGNGFGSRIGKSKIRFAFFPLENTCSASIWNGAGHTNDQDILEFKNQTGSGSSIKKDPTGKTRIIFNRINNGIPHQAMAMATFEASDSSNFLYVFSAILAYLSLVFYMAKRLIEIFLVSPVLEIASSAEAIARGREAWASKVQSGDELELLNNSFVELVTQLKQRNLLKNFVSEAAINDIENSDSLNLVPGGEYCEASILFASLKNKIPGNTDLNPQTYLPAINSFLREAEVITAGLNGQIDKILASTIMIVFRAGSAGNGHAINAVKAAAELAKRCLEKHGLELCAGIASGEVISGRIGSYRGKLDYTVIGDPVNLAARLKKESEESDAGIIISGNTMRLLKGKARVKFLKRCQIKGKSREFNIYEFLELR